MRKQSWLRWGIALGLILVPALAAGDTVEKNNGATLSGRIVADRPNAVVLEVESQGIIFRQTIPKSQIKSIQRDKPVVGPAFCLLPVRGTVGSDVTAEGIQAGFTEARAEHADYVILVIDTVGGGGPELAKVLDVMGNNRDLRPIAFVKRAFSAGAAVALACPRLYMATDGIIAASPRSSELSDSALADLLRSACRLGGHSDLWAGALSNSQIELTAGVRNGKKELMLAALATSGSIIKQKGQPLSVGAAEAEATGLSLAAADDTDSLGKALGVGPWHSAGDRAWTAVLAASARRGQHESASRDSRQQAAIDKLQQELDKCNATIHESDEAIGKLKDQWQAESAAIDADYQRTLQVAAGNSEFTLIQARADKQRQAKQKALANRYQPQFARLQQTRELAARHAADLAEKQRQLADSATDER